MKEHIKTSLIKVYQSMKVSCPLPTSTALGERKLSEKMSNEYINEADCRL